MIAMTMNWTYQHGRGVSVLELRGYLGDSALARFRGAIGWALARHAGPVVIDLTFLQGCSASGAAALEEAAQRAAAAGHVLAVCGTHGGAAAFHSWRDRQVAIPAYVDLETAVTALSPKQQEVLSQG
jgi:anti-anti-sigma regulatory factor